MRFTNPRQARLINWRAKAVTQWLVRVSASIFFVAVLVIPSVNAAPVSLRDVSSLPFIGPPAALEIDQQFDALASAAGLDPKVSEALSSVAGKRALWRAIGSYFQEQRSAMVKQALARYGKEDGSTFGQPKKGAGQANLFRPLVPYAADLQPDLKALGKLLKQIARSLNDKSELALRLRKVLESPGAAEAVYVSLFYPLYIARGEAPGIEDMLVRNARGQVEIGARFQADARGVVDRLKPLLATADQLTEESVATAAQIVEKDGLHRDFRKSLSDPMTSAISASLQIRRNPNISPSQLRNSVSGKLKQRFDTTGTGKVLASGQTGDAMKKNLRLLQRLRAVGSSNANSLQVLFAGMKTRDALNQDLKNVMSTDLAAASLIAEDAFKPIAEVFRTASIFGSSLLEGEGGDWSINPHRQREMTILVAYLEQRLRDLQEHGKQLGRISAQLQPAEDGQSLTASTLLQMVEIETLRDIEGLAEDWIDEHFEPRGDGYRLRSGKAGQIEAIANAAAHDLVPLKVKTGPAGYSNAHTHLLQSSAYIYLGTRYANDVYFNEFEDHYAARVWGVFDWNVEVANNPEEYRQSLAKQAGYLRRIAKTHKKVVLYVFHTPKWLSASKSKREFDGRPAYLLHSPKDFAAWRKFVGETVRFAKKHLAGTEVYYEVWNEPEIYWPEGTDEYLRLYAETARAIRENHPEAKVGGAVMNGWDGRARGAQGGDPLNFELIRHTAKNGIPLDFIAWHHFELPLSQLEVAKQAYIKELRKAGVETTPEFVISEWSISGRGTGLEAITFAEYMLALYRSEVAIQAVSAWDEFSVLARPGHFPPWGMITHQGLKKPMFHVHRFFDYLSRNSQGIEVFESADGKARVVASRKRDGSLELVVWEAGYSRRLEAAIEVLRENDLSNSDLRQYGSIEQLEMAIRNSRAIQQAHAGAFRQASKTYQQERYRGNSLLLRLPGSKALRVTASETIGIRSLGRQVFSSGSELLLNLPRGEVMWLRVEVD